MSLIHRIKTVYRSLGEVWGNPDTLTYYPQSRRKSRLHICWDNLRWMLKHREINHFYYFYGCDRLEGPNPFDYVSKKKFIRRRDGINAKGRIGDKTVNYNCLLQDKFIFSQYLTSLNFPTPHVYGVTDKKTVHWIHPMKIFSWEDFTQQHTGSFFIKDILGERAERVFLLELQPGSLMLGGRQITLSGLKKKIGLKNILQERIYQHEFLYKINPHSVNTVRIVTVRSGDQFQPLSAMLRLGVKNTACDNLATGGVAVGLKIGTGQLLPQGIFKPGFGKWAVRHPETGFLFEGAKVPYFKEAVEMACSLHRYFYGIHSIGWDVAITPSGPVFLEGNNSWEIPTLQVFDKGLIQRYNHSLEQEDIGSVILQERVC